MAIVAEFSNSVNITKQALREQAEADRRLFEAMRQADDEQLFSRREWRPITNLDDTLEERLERQILRNDEQIAANEALLREVRQDEQPERNWRMASQEAHDAIAERNFFFQERI